MNWQWAFDELRRRQDEDRRHPRVEPGEVGWYEFSEMKHDRAMRRKRAGLTKKEADDWVRHAEELESTR